jgi:hypothetical protein
VGSSRALGGHRLTLPWYAAVKRRRVGQAKSSELAENQAGLKDKSKSPQRFSLRIAPSSRHIGCDARDRKARREGKTMEIEKQRWAPQPATCVKNVGGFGWSHPLVSTSHPYWEDVMELEDGRFLFDVEWKFEGAGAEGGWVAGAHIQKSCTEYASYPNAWQLAAGTGDDVAFLVKHAFDGKGARILDLDIHYDNNFPRFSVILVPNHGPAARAWWWGWGATAQNLTDVINGKAWANFKADNIKKKLVAIEREANGHFAFVLNEHKPGESSWWGFGAAEQNISQVISGKAWASFKADNIEKRLVSLKRFGQSNWTFIMVPREEGLLWDRFWNATWKELSDHAAANNQRIIDIERHGSSDDHFSAVLVQNQ